MVVVVVVLFHWTSKNIGPPCGVFGVFGVAATVCSLVPCAVGHPCVCPQRLTPFLVSRSQIPEGVRMEGSDGVNRLTYYVVQSSNMEKYYRLPDVTENQIVVARQLKKFMTGDLKAPVSGYPPFAGNEASFLRAQIACISADTLVAPTGFFDLAEAEEGTPTA